MAAEVLACAPFDPPPSVTAEEAALLGEGTAAAAAFPLDQTFPLHSDPTASKTIYLDFDGHVTSGTIWNTDSTGGADIVTPPYSFEGDGSFSDAELERIQHIWERVAEDYLPFHVDVTTEDPGAAALSKSGLYDTEWGIRVVIGGGSSDWYGAGAGGVAYVGSFNWNTDTPCFIFPRDLSNGNEKYTAEAISHEVGHTLYLEHDGTATQEYYTGHGSGATGWAPIMGSGYTRQLVQWSRGEYAGANNTEDDLAIITTRNGFGYRADDHGNSFAEASSLALTGGATVFAEGIIERNTDLDYFVFTTGAGAIRLDIDPFYRGANLDVLATLYDDLGTVVATSNPIGALDATISLSLSAGTYYLSIDGLGEGDPATGYSDYGSLGYYTVTGTIVDPDALPWVTVSPSDAAAAERGLDTARFTVSRTGDTAEAVEVFYSLAGTAEGGSDYQPVPTSVTLPAGAASADIVITPIDDDAREGEETVILTLQPGAAYYVGSPEAATVTIADDDLIVGVDDFAVSEATAAGSVMAGGVSATVASDDVYEEIRETESGGRPTSRRYSVLEHTWTFDVTGGAHMTFLVEAHHTANDEGDDFVFEYSTDGAHWTHLLTVTKTADDDTAQQAALPSGLAGTVYVRVRDTDHSARNRTKDTLYVDRLAIRSDPSLPGDATLDGIVDALDYLAYKLHAGTTAGATWLECDFDHDGDVDGADFLALETNFGQSLPDSAPPLPAPADQPPQAEAPAMALEPPAAAARQASGTDEGPAMAKAVPGRPRRVGPLVRPSAPAARLDVLALAISRCARQGRSFAR